MISVRNSCPNLPDCQYGPQPALPSILGGLASAVCGAVISNGPVGSPGMQLAGIGITLAVAIVTGSCTGAVMKCLKEDTSMADDSAYWDVADDFAP